jgi:hypothetical protein
MKTVNLLIIAVMKLKNLGTRLFIRGYCWIGNMFSLSKNFYLIEQDNVIIYVILMLGFWMLFLKHFIALLLHIK